jgi:hypothetical protein
MRRLVFGLAAVAAGVAVATVGSMVWIRWQERTAEARDRELRRCDALACSSAADCAAMCARRFVASNGYLAPELAVPDAAVLESLDWRDYAGRTIRDIVASRSRQVETDPTLLCTYEWGYQVLFPYASSKDPLWGRIISMDKAYGSLRMEHQQMVFTGVPTHCESTKWAKR